METASAFHIVNYNTTQYWFKDRPHTASKSILRVTAYTLILCFHRTVSYHHCFWYLYTNEIISNSQGLSLFEKNWWHSLGGYDRWVLTWYICLWKSSMHTVHHGSLIQGEMQSTRQQYQHPKRYVVEGLSETPWIEGQVVEELEVFTTGYSNRSSHGVQTDRVHKKIHQCMSLQRELKGFTARQLQNTSHFESVLTLTFHLGTTFQRETRTDYDHQLPNEYTVTK